MFIFKLTFFFFFCTFEIFGNDGYQSTLSGKSVFKLISGSESGRAHMYVGMSTTT